MTLEVLLVLLPHIIHNPILPFIGLNPLSWYHHIHFQFSSGLRMKTHFEVNWVIVIIHADLLRIVLPDEIVKHCKHWQNEGPNTHVILW